jgi:hypothetical protein
MHCASYDAEKKTIQLSNSDALYAPAKHLALQADIHAKISRIFDESSTISCKESLRGTAFPRVKYEAE